MQLITTRNKEISFAELKKAISSGNGLELIHPGDKFAIELKNGELVNAVCGGYVNEKRARFVLEDCLAEKWRMNDTPTNKGGYLKSEGRRHVLEDILPLFPDELAEAFEPRFMSEEIDGERHEYADTLWIPSATDVFGAGDWWSEEPDSFQLEIFKRERDRVKENIGDGFDMIIVRELTGGLYFGERHTEEVDGVLQATDTLTYNENEIRRIAIKAFDIAMKRRKHVISVDKANVLDSSRLWRKVVEEVAKDYPEVKLEHMLVDNCAMQLVMNPGQFDVVLTENMFGDILSDEASMITGSIGMLSSASLNETKFGMYEPSHGSAPDIAGKDLANPIATVLSAAMMLRYSFDMDKEADAIEAAVQQVLTDGYRTGDIYSEGCKKVGTMEMGNLIAAHIQ